MMISYDFNTRILVVNVFEPCLSATSRTEEALIWGSPIFSEDS